MNLLAQNIRLPDAILDTVVGQPAVGQIVFAVLVAFAIAAFAAKLLLNSSYIWCVVGTAFVTFFCFSSYLRQGLLGHLAQSQPAICLPDGGGTVLPLQMVAFGTLGAIWGYWLAIKYTYWRKHEA